MKPLGNGLPLIIAPYRLNRLLQLVLQVQHRFGIVIAVASPALSLSRISSTEAIIDTLLQLHSYRKQVYNNPAIDSSEFRSTGSRPRPPRQKNKAWYQSHAISPLECFCSLSPNSTRQEEKT